MRIGTWNLAGRWTPGHLEFLVRMDCDVLLVTEVSERLELPGYVARLSDQLMAPKRRWAGVLSRRELTALPDPHPASALARVDGLTFCSSILPWTSCGNRDPWHDGPHALKTKRTIDALLAELPTTDLVWGGDWNHALLGREWSGSKGGRTSIIDAVAKLNLEVPTTELPHAIDGLLSIDHIAVPNTSTVSNATRVSACRGSGRLSDHDAYVVELAD